ncbi:hypothetical protein [Nonomuraea sp. GTA35]|uniref:hypothetical protein n=1 Tax=Nonomuraea sp. GTA35 TaxID=1676746 RepID=UPI0035C1C3FC
MTVSEQPVSEQAAERRQDYDGTSPFPGAEEYVAAGRLQVVLTTGIVVVPFVALGVAISWRGGRESRSPICCWPPSCTW